MGFLPGLKHHALQQGGFFAAFSSSRVGVAKIADPAQRVEEQLQTHGQACLPTMVLAVIEQVGTHAPEHDFAGVFRQFHRGQVAAGFAAEVSDDNVRPIEDAKSGGLDAAAQIDLCVLEEEGGIEEAGFDEGFAAQD